MFFMEMVRVIIGTLMQGGAGALPPLLGWGGAAGKAKP